MGSLQGTRLPTPGLLISGRYELIAVAGRGGMADVWHAMVRGHDGFTRPVAVKQMHEGLSRQPNYVRMFTEEARLGATLRAPNIAEVYDYVYDGGYYYMVMEWLEGIDLGTWLKATPGATRWDLVVAASIGMLRGIQAAHERLAADGSPAVTLHRDISPHNVILTTSGTAKVIDFGLAHAADRTVELTEPGIIKGKMSYLAPEILKGQAPSVASDMFALGATIWETLAGRKCFDGETDVETFMKVRDGEAPDLAAHRPDLPPALVATIMRMVAPDPKARYHSARELVSVLRHLLQHEHHDRDLHLQLADSVRRLRGEHIPMHEPSVSTPLPSMASASQPEIDAPRPRGLWHRITGFTRRRTSQPAR